MGGLMAQDYCDDCCYSSKMGCGDSRYCAYIFKTGRRRPCPPGDACTEKVPRKVIRRKKKGVSNEQG